MSSGRRYKAPGLRYLKERRCPVRGLLNSMVGKLRKVPRAAQLAPGIASGLFLRKRLTERKLYLVKSDVSLKDLRELEIALASRYLLSSLSGVDRFGELAGLRVGSRESSERIRIFAARELHGLFGDFDCPIPIAS